MSLRWGVRTRTIVAALVPMLALGIGLSMLFSRERLGDLETTYRERGEAIAQQLAASAAFPLFAGDIDSLNQLLESALAQRDVVAAELQTTTDITILRRTRSVATGSAETSIMIRMPVKPLATDLGPLDHAGPGARAETGWVLLELSRSRLTTEANQFLSFAVVALLFGSLGGLLLAGWLARGVSGPIRHAASAVEQIGQGDFTVRVTSSGGGSLAQLAEGINTMARRLERHDDEQREAIRVATSEMKARSEEAVRANEAKSRFLAAASHDLRQPLHALGLFVAELESKSHAPDEKVLAQKIRTSVDTLRGLLDSLLDISRLDAGIIEPDPQNFLLQPLLVNLFVDASQAAESAGLGSTLRLPIEDRDGYSDIAHSDATLLARIIGNLLSNALRYTATGHIMLACRRRPNHFIIEVRDSGRGIPQEKQRTIFEEFVQLHNPARQRDQGLGLGLSIVKRLANLLNHPLQLRSRPGRGSVFAVIIPRVKATDITEVREPEQLDTLDGMKVALLEDDALVRDGMQRLLNAWGCTVVAATHVDALLNAFSRERFRPDILLCDLNLKEVLDGISAVADVRRTLSHPKLPAAFLSGDSSPETARRVRNTGIPLLLKPVQPAKLRALMQRLAAPHRYDDGQTGPDNRLAASTSTPITEENRS